MTVDCQSVYDWVMFAVVVCTAKGGPHGSGIRHHRPRERLDIVLKFGMTESPLAARRGSMRTFRSFEALVTYLRELGISQYHVNAADFDAQTVKSHMARPDSAGRMRAAFEAKAHAD